MEFFAATTDESDVPVYAPDRKYLERAKEHLRDNDYKAAAVYARTQFEAKLKKFCDRKNLRVCYKEKANELRSEDFWKAVEDARGNGVGRGNPDWAGLTDQVVNDVNRYRKVILNPLSHADWRTIHRQEVQDAIQAIEQLEAALDRIV